MCWIKSSFAAGFKPSGFVPGRTRAFVKGTQRGALHSQRSQIDAANKSIGDLTELPEFFKEIGAWLDQGPGKSSQSLA